MIIFDFESGKLICIIELDTIMPGYSVNDFGDAIRFGVTTALEDEDDLSKVNFDIFLYELYIKGGAMMMTFECGM